MKECNSRYISLHNADLRNKLEPFKIIIRKILIEIALFDGKILISRNFPFVEIIHAKLQITFITSHSICVLERSGFIQKDYDVSTKGVQRSVFIFASQRPDHTAVH